MLQSKYLRVLGIVASRALDVHQRHWAPAECHPGPCGSQVCVAARLGVDSRCRPLARLGVVRDGAVEEAVAASAIAHLRLHLVPQRGQHEDAVGALHDEREEDQLLLGVASEVWVHRDARLVRGRGR